MDKPRPADCQRTLNHEDIDTAPLTGFSTKAAAALVHLREAWLTADFMNRAACEDAIRALLRSHSLRDHGADLCRAILCHGVFRDAAATLWKAVDHGQWEV